MSLVLSISMWILIRETQLLSFINFFIFLTCHFPVVTFQFLAHICRVSVWSRCNRCTSDFGPPATCPARPSSCPAQTVKTPAWLLFYPSQHTIGRVAPGAFQPAMNNWVRWDETQTTSIILKSPLNRKCEFSFCTLPIPSRAIPSPLWCPSPLCPAAPSAGWSACLGQSGPPPGWRVRPRWSGTGSVSSKYYQPG